MIFGSAKAPSTAAQQPIALSALRIQTSVYGLVVPKGYGTNRIPANLIGYDDFVSTAVSSPTPTASSGGGKGGGNAPAASPTTSYTYSASLKLALCAGPIDGIGTVWQDKAVTSLATLGLALFTGTYPQAPWGYDVTNHPDKALGYNGLAYVANATFDLGTNASMPNHSFEVAFGHRWNPGAGVVDANMADVMLDFLTNPRDGAGFPAANLDANAQYRAYCTANGFFMSPVADSQQEARQYLADWAKLTNSAWVWSSGMLRLIPYGDAAVTGNGVTFTPDLSPQFDLTDDDFLDPPSFTRSSPADAFNSVKLETLDRANAYNTVAIEAKDQSAIEAFGLRQDSSITAHGICVTSVGQAVANLILQRALYVRNLYTVKLGWRYCVLDPMDLVTLTDSALGLNRQLVRLVTIDEDKGALTFTAEQVDIGIASHALHGASAGLGVGIDTNVAPPSTNPPLIFGAPIALVRGLELWMAACGPPGWGGCDIWVSSDGSTYKNVGRMIGSSRMGVLSAPFAAGADPDTVDTCSVDLSLSQGTMLTGTVQDADLATTLCYVADPGGGGEFFSYQTATLTGASRYDLKTYLRRGLYGSANAAHLAAARFVRLDKAIFKIPYSADQVGKTLYVKLTAFNVFGSAEQQTSDVTAVQIVCPPPPIPPDVTGFVVTQNGEVVNLDWDEVADPVLVDYDIRYGPAGVTSWDAMRPIAEGMPGTHSTNAAMPNGTWTFAIRARDIAGQLSVNPCLVTRTVLDANPLISAIHQEPLWTLGTLTNCTVSGGALMPSYALAFREPMWNVAPYSTPMWDVAPYAAPMWTRSIGAAFGTYAYEAPPVVFAKEALVRCSASVTAELLPGETGAPRPIVYVRYSHSLTTDPLMWHSDPTTPMWTTDPALMWINFGPYEIWTKGVLRASAVQMKIVSDSADGLAKITSFVPTVDQPTITDGNNGVAASPGGTRINFANLDYLNPPFVQATAQGAGLFATAQTIDAAGFTAHVFNGAGTDVGGAVNWTSHN